MYCAQCGRSIRKASNGARTLLRYGTDGRDYGATDLCSQACVQGWIAAHPLPAGVTACVGDELARVRARLAEAGQGNAPG